MAITANVPPLGVSGDKFNGLVVKIRKFSCARFSVYGKSVPAIAPNGCYSWWRHTNIGRQNKSFSIFQSNFHQTLVFGLSETANLISKKRNFPFGFFKYTFLKIKKKSSFARYRLLFELARIQFSFSNFGFAFCFLFIPTLVFQIRVSFVNSFVNFQPSHQL